MELVMEMIGAQQHAGNGQTSRTFRAAGGVIGRNDNCDWVIPDPRRYLSGQHAEISYRDGSFYLTDVSSNGVSLRDSGERLGRGQPHRIEHGAVFCLGEFEIRARIQQDPADFEAQVGKPVPAGQIIPDDAFLDLDPLRALDQQEHQPVLDDYSSSLGTALVDESRGDYARIDMESLRVPELVQPAPQPQPVQTPPPVTEASGGFWQALGQELGLALHDMPAEQREAVALQAASLLGQCIAGLQQSLRTRSELKNELRLAQTTIATAGNNPLKSQPHARDALASLLGGQAGRQSARQLVKRAFHDLQAHQVALLAGSRAAVGAIHEQFAPEQLLLRFERSEQRSWLPTSGSRWRAYKRLHRRLQEDGNWGEQHFVREFARAYEEQARLVATLHAEA